MRITSALLSLLFLVFLASSCKKGVDDPAFTVLSRKARLAGEWKMTEGTVTLGYKDASGIYPAEVYKMDEDGYSRTQPGRGANFNGNHKLALQITKDGNFLMNQQLDSMKFEFNGTWQFEGKSSDSKNKEKINMKVEKANNSTGYYVIFNKSLTNFKYRIKELRNKKLVLFCTEEMLDINSSYGIYVTAEYTFVQ